MSSWHQRTGVQRIIPDHCRTQTLHRVSVAETDMMGIVHHANYVLLFERGRLEYLRRRGLPYKDMVERGYHMPVVELNVRYRKPAHFDDLLRLETRLGALSRVTVRFDYIVSRPRPDATEPAELLLEGHILLACVDVKNRPRALPEDVVPTLFLPESSASDDPVIPGSRADRAGIA
jgi:acyl-CoA thioester hydrolase